MTITFKDIKAKRAIVQKLKVDLEASRERWRKLNDEAVAEKAKGIQLRITYDIEIAALREMGSKFALDEGEEDVTPALPGIVDDDVPFAPTARLGSLGIPINWGAKESNYECDCACCIKPLSPCIFHKGQDEFNDKVHRMLWYTKNG